MSLPNPGHDADMLRRAATACRNAQRQMQGRTAWFDWVPQHLEQLATRLDSEFAPDAQAPPT